MAGAKGRSGGARPNSGGARPGAGRKKKPVVDQPDGKPPAALTYTDPVDFLMTIVNDPTADKPSRVRAAIAAAQYLKTKTHDGGKKEAAKEKGKVASAGRLAPSSPPRLAVVSGR